MGIEAAMACLESGEPSTIDGLLLRQHQRAVSARSRWRACVATARTCRASIAVADFGGSARAGVAALRAALRRAWGPAACARALVVAADVRAGRAGVRARGALGDGAVAAMRRSRRRRDRRARRRPRRSPRNSPTSGAPTSSASCRWRTRASANQYGIARDVPEAVNAALRQAELPPGRRRRALALAVPDARTAADCAKQHRLRPDDAAASPSLDGRHPRQRRIRWCCCRARSRRRTRATSSWSRRTARAPTRWCSAPPTRSPARRPRAGRRAARGGHPAARRTRSY